MKGMGLARWAGQVEIAWVVHKAKMIIPVRCFTCGKVIGNKWDHYLDLLQADYSEGDALDALGLVRYCSRRMLMTHVDLIEKLLNYNRVSIGVYLRENKNYGNTRAMCWCPGLTIQSPNSTAYDYVDCFPIWEERFVKISHHYIAITIHSILQLHPSYLLGDGFGFLVPFWPFTQISVDNISSFFAIKSSQISSPV
ncbi:unnamed protein product [Citrullus colocynthis]|uniref:Uncharacterized protein n=1 Tax=Citrullus colocynthis TaxID=252529 RepID=A0ABP0XYA7_9ROSI